MAQSHIITAVEQGIMTLTFNRAEKKNAITQDMYRQLTAALQQAEQDEAIHAIVITGSGDSFTAGNDLADFIGMGEIDASAPVFEFLHCVARLSVPMIAAVNGLAIGIGTTLLLHCDIVIAARSAQFALPFAKLGLVPEAGSSQLLPLLTGHLRASEWLLLGDNFAADDAEQAGIVSKVVDDQALAETIDAYCQRFRQIPVSSLRASKALINAPLEPVPDRINREVKSFAKALQHADTQATIQAKLQKK